MSTPTCPGCGDETDWYDRAEGEAYYCDLCSADKMRHEPGTGCMGH